MGDIADMMLDGTLDAITGEYIGKPVGYPRTLDGSLPWEKTSKKRHNPYNGICKWIENSRIRLPKNEQKASSNDKIILAFGTQKGITSDKPSVIAREISNNHFPEFKKWLKETYSYNS